MEDESNKRRSLYDKVEREMRRRTWYSLYVLDCLLSLQLGRPLAIQLCDTAVTPPCRLNDLQFDLENDEIPSASDGPLFADYFRAVVQFSYILDQVVHGLYGPKYAADSDLKTNLIEDLDRLLLQWRAELPRVLRFDLGHAFENSITFKRQVCL